MSILLSFHVVVKIQSRSIYSILSMLVGTFYQKHVHLLPDETPFEIKNNPKLYPYFRNCCGAIDGSHFHVWVLSDSMARYRNCKGFIGQNVLAACNFAMLFVYILSGWEGSASDSAIFKYAREHNFTVPAGKYYLADAGFPLCDVLLTPYRGVRYHLKEWGTARQRSVCSVQFLVLSLFYNLLTIHAGHKPLRSYSVSDTHRLAMLLSASSVY
jgi:hypothetical protein